MGWLDMNDTHLVWNQVDSVTRQQVDRVVVEHEDVVEEDYPARLEGHEEDVVEVQEDYPARLDDALDVALDDEAVRTARWTTGEAGRSRSGEDGALDDEEEVFV